MYKRSIETSLRAWRESPTRKPLVLNGARQVGKTSVLKAFAAQNFAKVHYFNFETDPGLARVFNESLEPRKIIGELALLTNSAISVATDVVIFDEIQECPAALNSLKYFCEELPALAVCAAGSLLGVRLSSDSYPVGKVDELAMHPMSFHEFLLALRENFAAQALDDATNNWQISENLHHKLWDLWKTYLVVGGLPEVVRDYEVNREDIFLALKAARERQLLLISQYIRDMSKHAGAANGLHLERIFRAVPAQLARAQDDSVQRFRFTGVVPGVSQYSRLVSAFDWLAGAGLVYRVPIVDQADIPLTQFVKENFFKLYVFDCGILGALGDIPTKDLLGFNFGSYKGYIAENFVLQALYSYGAGRIYGWSSGKAEIEFLLSDAIGITPIEVKSGNVRQAKSLGIYLRKYNPKKAIIYGATTPRTDGVVQRRPIYTAGITDSK